MLWYIALSLFVAYAIIKFKVIKIINRWRKIIMFTWTLPGPPPLAVLKIGGADRVLEWFQNTKETYGPLFRIWFGLHVTVGVCDPDDIKEILSSNQLLHKSATYDMIRPWLGDGLLTSGGDKWRAKRKSLTPAFHFQILSGFHNAMKDCCNIMISKLKLVADGREVDIYPYITLYTLDIICETAMGIKKHTQEQSDSYYVESVKTMCRVMFERSFSPWKRIPFLFSFCKDSTNMYKALEILHGETRRVIAERKKLLEEEATTNDDTSFIGNVYDKKINRRAFLDMLLIAQREGQGLSDEDIREEVDTFMFEGHDTTSSAIGFAVYLLSMNEDVQKKLYEEVKNLSYDEYGSMRYMEAVIKETLRLYPSVPFYSRRLEEDFQLGERTLPEGISVGILTYCLHRDPKYYPEPEKFDPDRFLGEQAVDRHPFAHVAFSAGPRNCIGQKFAMLELKCTLSKLIKEFEIMPVEGFKLKVIPEVVIKSMNGIKVRLRPRS